MSGVHIASCRRRVLPFRIIDMRLRHIGIKGEIEVRGHIGFICTLIILIDISSNHKGSLSVSRYRSKLPHIFIPRDKGCCSGCRVVVVAVATIGGVQQEVGMLHNVGPFRHVPKLIKRTLRGCGASCIKGLPLQVQLYRNLGNRPSEYYLSLTIRLRKGVVNRPFHQEKRSSYLRAFTGRFVVNLFGCLREVSKLLYGTQLSFETTFSLIVSNNDYLFEPNLFGVEREKHSLPVFPFCFIGASRSGCIILIDFVLPKLLLTHCLEK